MTVAPRLLRPDQVAEILQKKKRTIYYYVQTGKLTGHNSNGSGRGKKGLMILASSVEEFIKKYTLPDYEEEANIGEKIENVMRKRKRQRSGWVGNW